MNQNELNPQQPQTPQPYYYQMPPPEDEIDLFELFASLFAQWRLIIGITIIGALISISIALATPKIYETRASVRAANTSQIAAINENGYTKLTAQQLFKRYYDQVKSKQNLKNYLIKTNALPLLVPGLNKADIDKTAVAFADNFSVTILEPEARKGEVVKFPELFQVSLSTTVEPEAVALLNRYLQHVEGMILIKIKEDGATEVKLKVNRIQRDIEVIRSNAKKLKEFEFARVSEAFNQAKHLKIVTPTTINNLSQQHNSNAASTQITINQKNDNLLFLMGTDYLGNKKDILKKRVNDDPFISSLPGKLNELERLKHISFEFGNASLHQIDRAAAVDGIAEKPNRKLIVVLGTLLSGMLALFIALIVATIKKRALRQES